MMDNESKEILPFNRRYTTHEIYLLNMSYDKKDNMLALYSKALDAAEKEIKDLYKLFNPIQHDNKESNK